QRHFGELRLSTVFGGCGEAGARIPVRVECAAGRRSARAADGVSLRRNFRAGDLPAGNERHRAGERGRYGRVQGEVPVCLSAGTAALEFVPARGGRTGGGRSAGTG